MPLIAFSIFLIRALYKLFLNNDLHCDIKMLSCAWRECWWEKRLKENCLQRFLLSLSLVENCLSLLMDPHGECTKAKRYCNSQFIFSLQRDWNKTKQERIYSSDASSKTLNEETRGERNILQAPENFYETFSLVRHLIKLNGIPLKNPSCEIKSWRWRK